MDSLVVMLHAFREAISELQEHYASADARVAAAPPAATASGRDPSLALPYPLRDPGAFRDVQPLQQGKLLYAATDVASKRRVCVKFAPAGAGGGGVAVQRAWAAAGLAPEVLSCKALPGGFSMVTMEYLSPDSGWRTLFELPERERGKALKSAERALARAHTVPVAFGSSGGQGFAAHGDCRSANVMVRRKPAAPGGRGRAAAEYEVRFIDFDWAGSAGVQRYPAFMAPRRDPSAPTGSQPSAVPWPAGARPGCAMEQAHDIELLRAETLDPAVVVRRQPFGPWAVTGLGGGTSARRPRPAAGVPSALPPLLAPQRGRRLLLARAARGAAPLRAAVVRPLVVRSVAASPLCRPGLAVW